MRLTLRTLLAYLDDVLEPSQTKVMGQKIQESDVAGKLISLIRLVVRQRRLKAPSVSGPNIGIDPNVVAQYLDNTLAPEQVVEVEKVLLSSDELLAEVASCHQVLALVMGKHVDVPQASRDRLYALGPVDQSDQLRVEEPRTNAVNDGVSKAAARDSERAESKNVVVSVDRHEVPEYLRGSSWSQKVVPAAVVALLIVVCVGLLVFDRGFLTGINEAKRELSKAEREATPTLPDANPSGKGSNEPAVIAANTPAKTNVSNATIPPSPIDPPPPPDAPDPANNKKPMPSDDVPADAAVVVNRTPPATATVADNTAPPVGKEPSPLLNPAVVQYTSNDGVVLRLDEQQHHWFLLPRRSAVAPGELMVVLEPYDAVLDIDRGAMIATVMGDSAIRLLPPDRVTSSGLDIRRGRLMLRSSRKDPTQSPLISIRVGEDLWTLEFLSGDTVCSIEVAPREPVQFEKPLGANWYVGVLRVLAGSAKWSVSGGPSQTIGSESALEIASPQPNQPLPTAVSSSFVPDWTDAQKRKQAPLRRFAALFEKQFDLDLPVEQTLLALLKDSNAKIVELAVHGLVLTESVPGMVQALAECTFEEGRSAASDGLRTWLAREGERGPALKGVLEQRYQAPEASAIYIMLWGFRPEDASNRAQCLELVNWLRSTHVEIRELAYYWVVRLSGRKWEFRAVDVPARREGHVRKIEQHIMSTGALVKPSDNPAPKP